MYSLDVFGDGKRRRVERATPPLSGSTWFGPTWRKVSFRVEQSVSLTQRGETKVRATANLHPNNRLTSSFSLWQSAGITRQLS